MLPVEGMIDGRYVGVVGDRVGVSDVGQMDGLTVGFVGITVGKTVGTHNTHAKNRCVNIIHLRSFSKTID